MKKSKGFYIGLAGLLAFVFVCGAAAMAVSLSGTTTISSEATRIVEIPVEITKIVEKPYETLVEVTRIVEVPVEVEVEVTRIVEVPVEVEAADSSGGVLDDLEYATMALPLMEPITTGLYSFGELFIAAGADINLMFSSHWGTDVLYALGQIEDGCRGLSELTPSTTMVAAHDELMLGCDDLITAGELIAVFVASPGFDETSLALLTSATEYINNGTVHITASTALLDEIDY